MGVGGQPVKGPIRAAIASERQPYLDEPVYVEVSKAKPLAREVAAIFGRKVLAQIEELSHYNRVQLRWMTPDGRGGLVPRGQGNGRHRRFMEKK